MAGELYPSVDMEMVLVTFESVEFIPDYIPQPSSSSGKQVVPLVELVIWLGSSRIVNEIVRINPR